MDIQAHYQALYNTVRTALDVAHSTVPLVHVTSKDDVTGRPETPPFVVYRQDVERPIGSTGGGPSKVLRSSWVFSPYTEDFASGLALASVVVNALAVVVPTLVTTDGYATTHFAIEGFQPLYEQDANLYASHLRIFWERSL